jgi:hypothetical protein
MRVAERLQTNARSLLTQWVGNAAVYPERIAEITVTECDPVEKTFHESVEVRTTMMIGTRAIVPKKDLNSWAKEILAEKAAATINREFYGELANHLHRLKYHLQYVCDNSELYHRITHEIDQIIRMVSFDDTFQAELRNRLK